MKAFIEFAKSGAVLISFGTNVRSDQLGNKILTEFLNVINQFPDFNFLWKFESEELPKEKPKNLLISKFLPQTDILAHPNVKGFVSHCGLLSSHEAAWRGKPVVAIPFFADQHRVR